MKQGTAIAAMVIPAIGVGGYLLLSGYLLPWQKYLNITVGAGGTTDPPPGRYKKLINENVTLTAIPDYGYTVGTWTVDGADYGHVDTISVTMDTNHSVIATFWKGGKKPPTEASKIKSMGPATVIQNLGVWNTDYLVRIWPWLDDWSWVGWATATMQFQVLDAGNLGVPDVSVAVWTDPSDTSRYSGTALIEGNFHGVNTPLALTTDADGLVTIHLAYKYGLTDAYKQLCKDADVAATILCFVPPIVIPLTCNVYDKCNMCHEVGCAPMCVGVYSIGGDCQTIMAGCEKMGPFAVNRVYTSVIGTLISTYELASCGFHIKWVTKPQAQLTSWSM